MGIRLQTEGDAMAALTEERYRPADARAAKGPRSRGSFTRHKTRSSSDTVKQSEQSLKRLLEDFEEGRLNAFGRRICRPEAYCLENCLLN